MTVVIWELGWEEVVGVTLITVLISLFVEYGKAWSCASVNGVFIHSLGWLCEPFVSVLLFDLPAPVLCIAIVCVLIVSKCVCVAGGEMCLVPWCSWKPVTWFTALKLVWCCSLGIKKNGYLPTPCHGFLSSLHHSLITAHSLELLRHISSYSPFISLHLFTHISLFQLRQTRMVRLSWILTYTLMFWTSWFQ